MDKMTIAVLFSILFSCFASAMPFEKAVPVWAEGQATEMNSHVRFRTAFETDTGEGAVLRVTGANAYRICLNGTFVGYGPARAPKGFFRTDEWPLAASIRRGRNELEIEASGYNCNSFYFQDQPAFLQAEVVCGGKVVAATAADGDFTAETTERVRKVPRYSFQRTFAEVYRLGGGRPASLKLENRPPVRYLERIASYPAFDVNDRLKIVSRARAAYDSSATPRPVFFVEAKDPTFKTFAKSDLEANPWDDMQKVRFSSRTPYAGGPGTAFALKDGESAMTDAGLNDCGFFGMSVKVTKPGRLLFTFDEVLTDGEVDPTRMTCCNCVEWRFERPGTYAVETFEPYVFRYANLIADGGAFEVSGLHVRTYKNPDAGRASFRCSDPAYGKIFAAARETFVQNAVDVFTDCPSRERAGWLCDSFFIGRVNALLTGDTKLERLFLQNFAVSDGFENHPDGAIPMCYPADELRGRFIPNWAMWLVIEVEEYLKRSGDRATVDALRPRLVAFVDYMKTFRNSDGLLEKLPSWVFVEWSQANKLVQDVNYPSNMTWAEVLDAMNRLYGMQELAAEAEKVRETVRRQSWTGKWFCDNAVRQPDGTLKLSGECTETCQYYAFFFRTATPKTHPELWKTLVEDFGPKRLAADGKTLKSHPEIWPSNAFIGNYLRLECLAREGLVGNILDETKGFFLYMAERTGTLWEMISPTASCDHGFASHAAVYLFRDIIGIKSVDAKTRQVVVEPPEGIDLGWVEGTLPVSPTETVTIGWRRGEKPTVRWSVRTIAAEWIAGSYVPPAEKELEKFFEPARNDVVEKRFAVRDAAVSRATWRVAAPGMRDLFVNGVCVSPTALPPLTPYRKRILEESFDVTAEIRRGAENVLRVELGNGWWNPLPLPMWYHYNLREFLAVGTPCVKATLEIAYADGARETVETDGAWMAAKGRIVKNSVYLGVLEDKRLEVDFTESARVVRGPEGKVVPAGDFPKTVVIGRDRAQGVTLVSNNVWLVDMGDNATGTLRVRLRGVPAGAKVAFRQGERVNPDGTVNVMSAVTGQIKKPEKGPLFAIAEQRDSVIGDGSAEFVFEPRFTFHVFRYVQVEGPCEAPRAEDFERLRWSADVKDRSSFACSNEKLNRLHEICRRTFRSNLQSVQSDCPGREKFGYGGDIACTLDAFWSNYDMAAFYRKTLQDFLDEAEDDGLFTETAPFVGIASRSCYPVAAQEGESGMLAGAGTRAAPIGWTVGAPLIVDSLVRYAGDMESLRLAYPAFVRFIDLLARRYPKHDIPDCLGDWIAIPSDKANCRLSGLAHWHQFVALTAKFARLLGKADDAARFGRLADDIAATFRREFVRADGTVGSGFQGEQLFALYHGLLEEKDVPAAYGILKRNIRAHGDALTTGIFTTKYLFEYLPTHGDAALAAKVATHEGYPGWFHMMDRGATTLWEDWDEERCLERESNCHPMFGSVDEWMIRHVLGVSVCDDAVGCDKVRIAPQPLPGVTSASGWFDTPKGRIEVSWKTVDGKAVVEKTVPDGVTVVNEDVRQVDVENETIRRGQR